MATLSLFMPRLPLAFTHITPLKNQRQWYMGSIQWGIKHNDTNKRKASIEHVSGLGLSSDLVFGSGGRAMLEHPLV